MKPNNGSNSKSKPTNSAVTAKTDKTTRDARKKL
ncbi:hypothetical protein CCACVL1_19157 [Corchorus capsularis]|uniref:Uncharacterized protein n=1 Tax=Corchorus capsularis TaxID=210143 RepID=A0A1R3HI99_COCAP|nr:hypothetical protein CCACVL1_19157 [Corchorus capsularis]